MKLTAAQVTALTILGAATEPVRLHGRTEVVAGKPRVAPRVADRLVDLGLAEWADGPRRMEAYAAISDAGRRWLTEHP